MQAQSIILLGSGHTAPMEDGRHQLNKHTVTLGSHMFDTLAFSLLLIVVEACLVDRHWP